MTEAVVPEPTQAPANTGPLRIKRFTITDFRAFPGPAPAVFELDGKNLLVYGENGAGKSSLFHALQDFFSLQPSRNLAIHKNVFSGEPDDQCKVVVEFVGQETAPAEWTSKRHPCTQDFNTPVGNWYNYFFAGADSRVLDAARRTACLDYKSLLDTNYKHGAGEVNLFDVAVTTLLRDYRVSVSGGTESTLGVLWQQVLEAQQAATSTKPPAKALTRVNQSCIEFNTAFRSALDRLLPEVNRILVSLGWQDVVLKSLQTPGVSYKNVRLRRDRIVEGQRLIPELTYRSHPLDRPQMFLNEARLSGLALALYLGGRLACTPSGESQSLKLMVLDDVLVGLDHSNRLPVLDVLATHFTDWQIVLLTHDRTWFELTQSHVDEKAWQFVEVYEGDAKAKTPCPIVRMAGNRPAKNLLSKAKELLTTPYLEAAANYTRQGFELAIRGACEAKGIDMPYRVYPKGHKKPLESQAFLDKLKQWKASDQQKQTTWDDALKCLGTMKSVVMNPYSHPSAPNIPKQEIQQAIDAVENFLGLVK